MIVRPTISQDIPALKQVLDDTGLFPSEILNEMIAGFLSEKASEEVWLTCEGQGTAIGFCYAVPEKLTEGTWNMLALAVLPAQQGKGVGAAIVSALENNLRKAGNRILIADTSGTSEFELTRAFYRKQGYAEEARIRDFWAAGNDKVVYWKALS